MGKFYRINQYIQAKEVRVVDESGNQVGILPIVDALNKTREVGLDLVEVAPNANPPVCKIIDFKKFKYIEAKKEKEEKRGQKKGELKEVVFSPFIAQNDFDTRIKKIERFIKNGHKIKIRILFRGREITKKEFGYKIIEQILSELNNKATMENEIKFQGRELFVILAPIKQNKKSL